MRFSEWRRKADAAQDQFLLLMKTYARKFDRFLIVLGFALLSLVVYALFRGLIIQVQ